MNGDDVNEQPRNASDRPMEAAPRKVWHAPKLTVKEIQSTELGGYSFSDNGSLFTS